MPEDADARRARLLGVAHLAGLELLVELARDGAVAVERGRADEGQAGGVARYSGRAAARSTPPVVSCSLPPPLPSPTSFETVKAQSVPYQPARAERSGSLGEALRPFALVVPVEDRLREPPERVAGEADASSTSSPLPNGCSRDLRAAPPLVRALLAAPSATLIARRPITPYRTPFATKPARPSRSTHGLLPARRPFAAIDPVLTRVSSFRLRRLSTSGATVDVPERAVGAPHTRKVDRMRGTDALVQRDEGLRLHLDRGGRAPATSTVAASRRARSPSAAAPASRSSSRFTERPTPRVSGRPSPSRRSSNVDPPRARRRHGNRVSLPLVHAAGRFPSYN